jgi:hypothetical protein
VTAKTIRAALDERQVRHLISALLGHAVSPEEVAEAVSWQLPPSDLVRVSQLPQERSSVSRD